MSKQILVPVNGLDDAAVAIPRIPEVADVGDEVVILVISEVPEAELVNAETPPTSPPTSPPDVTIDRLALGPRAPGDKPSFVNREELMELQARDICENVLDRTQVMRDRGIEVRVEPVFSDTPVESIRDTAGDLDVSSIMVTSAFKQIIDAEDENLAEVLPGT